MKTKRFILYLSCLMIAIVLGGCATSKGNGSYAEKATKNTIETISSSAKARAKSTASKEASGTKVKVGEQFEIPGMFEITLGPAEWRDQVSYSGDGISYTYGEQKPDSSYFVITADVKNIGTEDETVGSDFACNLSSNLKINNKYKISSDMMVEDGGQSPIGPMLSSRVIIYGRVSNEIKNVFESCTLKLTAQQPDEDGRWHSDATPEGIYTAQYQ